MKLGQTIKDLRLVKSRMNQEQFCKKLGITQSYLSQIENDLKTPSTEMLKNISEVFEIPMPILLFKSLEATDVCIDKVDAFNVIKPEVDKLINPIFGL